MALTKAQVREILSAAGVDSEHMSEAVDRIISGHTASIEALREERDNYKAKAEQADELATENAKLKEDAKAYADKDYDKLKAEYDQYKSDVAKKETRSQKESAYKSLLKEAGIAERHHAKIIKYSDIDGIELDEKGNAKNAKALLKSIEDEWGDHAEKSEVSGAKTATPPKSTGGVTKTKDEIMQIKDTSERQAALMDYYNAQASQN